jgi:signal transduction protein with GAF and PtsI domain
MSHKLPRKFDFREFKAISRAISTYEDLNVLIKHLVEGTCQTFKAKGCSVLLLDERENQLFRMASCGLSERYIRKGPIFVVKEQLCAICTGSPVFTVDVKSDPRVQYPDAAVKEGIVSMLSIPIMSRDAIIGVMRIYHGEPLELHEDDIDSLTLLLKQLGLVIENKGLKNFVEQVRIGMGRLPPRLLEGL